MPDKEPKILKQIVVYGLSPREQAYRDSLSLYQMQQPHIKRLNDEYAYYKSQPEGSANKFNSMLRISTDPYTKYGSNDEAHDTDVERKSFSSKIFPVNPKNQPFIVNVSKIMKSDELSDKWFKNIYPIFKKPVHDPTPMRGMQPLPATIDISNQQERNIQSVPNGFTTDMPYRPGIKIFHNQQGKPIWFINKVGERRPYVSSPEINSVLTKDFVYPNRPKAQEGLRNEEDPETGSMVQWDNFTDLGTRLSNAIFTFGSSAIGDAIYGVNPDAAKFVEKYSGGMIPYTHQKQLQHARGSDLTENIIGQVVPAVTTAAGFTVGSKGVQMAYQKGKPIVQKAIKKFFDDRKFKKKYLSGKVPDEEIEELYKQYKSEFFSPKNKARIEASLEGENLHGLTKEDIIDKMYWERGIKPSVKPEYGEKVLGFYERHPNFIDKAMSKKLREPSLAKRGDVNIVEGIKEEYVSDIVEHELRHQKSFGGGENLDVFLKYLPPDFIPKKDIASGILYGANKRIRDKLKKHMLTKEEAVSKGMPESRYDYYMDSSDEIFAWWKGAKRSGVKKGIIKDVNQNVKPSEFDQIREAETQLARDYLYLIKPGADKGDWLRIMNKYGYGAVPVAIGSGVGLHKTGQKVLNEINQ